LENLKYSLLGKEKIKDGPTPPEKRKFIREGWCPCKRTCADLQGKVTSKGKKYKK
tara:strand:+ start:412 stop:576 length:165 start_codon:yes stop_codon:yes gene_type:complete